jgi:hypothetical protein
MVMAMRIVEQQPIAMLNNEVVMVMLCDANRHMISLPSLSLLHLLMTSYCLCIQYDNDVVGVYNKTAEDQATSKGQAHAPSQMMRNMTNIRLIEAKQMQKFHQRHKRTNIIDHFDTLLIKVNERSL